MNEVKNTEEKTKKVSQLEVKIDRDIFTRRLIKELAGVLQNLIGIEQANGYISLVGAKIGKMIEGLYKKALDVEMFNTEQIIDILLDIKKRIGADFYLISKTPEKIVLGNRQCPFEEDVKGCPSLCMMTSTVFGGIVSRNTGYAKVCLQATIAEKDAECRVVIYLQNTDEAQAAHGIEYFKDEEINL